MPDIHSSGSYNVFRSALLKFIRPIESKGESSILMPQIKVLPKLRLGVSHLYDHKFRDGFMDMLNPLCSSSIEAEATISYYCTVSSAI